MSEKPQMSTTENANATTLDERSLPTSDLQIAMPETKPPKPTSGRANRDHLAKAGR